MDLIKNCCDCIYHENCQCQLHLNNAACLTIQKPINVKNDVAKG